MQFALWSIESNGGVYARDYRSIGDWLIVIVQTSVQRGLGCPELLSEIKFRISGTSRSKQPFVRGPTQQSKSEIAWFLN
jgi:hypothetical protein